MGMAQPSTVSSRRRVPMLVTHELGIGVISGAHGLKSGGCRALRSRAASGGHGNEDTDEKGNE